MILRVLNLVVIGALVLAAAYVYRIKFDSTVQGERLAKLRGEVRHERDEIAALRAEWGQLDNPERIEALAKRYLQLKPIAPTQFDNLDHLPERPPQSTTAAWDPIGGMIGNLPASTAFTGSIPAAATAPSDDLSPVSPVPAESGAQQP
jgi:cell division protein FtsL